MSLWLKLLFLELRWRLNHSNKPHEKYTNISTQADSGYPSPGGKTGVSQRQERVYHGVAASPGLVQGPAFVFFQKELEIPIYGVVPEKHAREVERFQLALKATKGQIHDLRNKVLKRLGEKEAQIFDAHLLVLEDNALIEETVQEHKKTSYNIEHCFQGVIKRYIEAFENIDDEYIRERALDIRDVTKRVLANLLGKNEYNFLRFDEPKVIVAKDLAPSDTADLSKDVILAVLIDSGSRTSHTVIMARSLQIPAVVGLHDITDLVSNDDFLVVDGYEGTVTVNPTEETLRKYCQTRRERTSIQKIFDDSVPLPTKTKDGHRLSLCVNIEGVKDLRRLHTVGSDGVGLFRTEMLFLAKQRSPAEEEQFQAFKDVVSGMEPLPVTIRTLDLGGDKKISSYFLSEKEANPFMGFRAIRFCLEYEDLFKEQLRAILRASAHGKVRLMYPMVTSVEEVAKANQLLEESKEDLRKRGVPFDDEMPVGCMIETPAAAMSIESLSQYCSFFSIGTNDLIQYVLAVDRVNDRVAHLYQPNHPAVIKFLGNIVKQAHDCERSVGVCGEMAGDPLYAPLLIGLGVDSLSVSPSMLPEIKYLMRTLRLDDAKEMASKILKEQSAHAILTHLREFYSKQVGDVLQLA